jgi:hypothetical protein
MGFQYCFSIFIFLILVNNRVIFKNYPYFFLIRYFQAQNQKAYSGRKYFGTKEPLSQASFYYPILSFFSFFFFSRENDGQGFKSPPLVPLLASLSPPLSMLPPSSRSPLLSPSSPPLKSPTTFGHHRCFSRHLCNFHHSCPCKLLSPIKQNHITITIIVIPQLFKF